MSAPAKPARGVRNGAKRRIVVSLDPRTFEGIVSAATRQGVTTSEAIRRLIRRGIGEKA